MSFITLLTAIIRYTHLEYLENKNDKFNNLSVLLFIKQINANGHYWRSL